MAAITIDLYFPVRGREIPVDHGYALYSAISRVLEKPEDPWLHAREDVGIQLIRGRYQGKGRLALAPGSRIGIRLPAALVPGFLPLAGKKLDIGTDVLHIGIPQPYALEPAATMYAHMVTTKNGQDEVRFDAEVSRQLEALGVRGDPQRGPRRNFRVKDKTVVAHTLQITGLSDEDSIRLQEHGIGGRRKLGCGIFVPAT